MTVVVHAAIYDALDRFQTSAPASLILLEQSFARPVYANRQLTPELHRKQ